MLTFSHGFNDIYARRFHHSFQPCDCNTVALPSPYDRDYRQIQGSLPPPSTSAVAAAYRGGDSSIENEFPSPLASESSLLGERVVVFLFEPGQFHLTHAGVAVGQGRVELVEVQQDVVSNR